MQRAAAQRYGTFPDNQQLFRVPEKCLAAFLDCRLPHGIAQVHQDSSLRAQQLEKDLPSPATEKNYQDGTNITPKQQHGPTTRRDTPKSAWEDCEMATKKTEQLYKVSSPCLDDHHIKEFDAVGELFEVFSQSVLKCFTWHELVGQSEQSFKIRNKIDTSLWQTIGKTNVIHSSDKELPSL